MGRQRITPTQRLTVLVKRMRILSARAERGEDVSPITLNVYRERIQELTSIIQEQEEELSCLSPDSNDKSDTSPSR